MRWNSSIDDRRWYYVDGVTDLTTELNILFRQMSGNKIHETADIFHVVLMTDKTRRVKLYFASNVSKKKIDKLFYDRANPISSKSPLSEWDSAEFANTGYKLDYDHQTTITARNGDHSNDNEQKTVEPTGPKETGTEFEKAIEKLRESKQPRLLSLVIGKYHTKQIRQNVITSDVSKTSENKPSDSDIFGQTYHRFKNSIDYGRCDDSSYDKTKYVFQPIELFGNRGWVSKSDLAIGAYKSLAPNVQDVEIVQYTPEQVIPDIVYQKLPPEIVYRTSLSPFYNCEKKSTIVLVDEQVNSVLGA